MVLAKENTKKLKAVTKIVMQKLNYIKISYTYGPNC